MRLVLIGVALGVLGYGLFRSWMIIPSWAVVATIAVLLVAIYLPFRRRK